MIYLVERKTLDPPIPLQPFPSPSASRQEVRVQEDDVDKILAAIDGKVHRKKDPQMWEVAMLCDGGGGCGGGDGV